MRPRAAQRPRAYVRRCGLIAADLTAAQQSIAAWPSSSLPIRSLRRGVDRAEIERR
jgi:hypothetical protein